MELSYALLFMIFAKQKWEHEFVLVNLIYMQNNKRINILIKEFYRKSKADMLCSINYETNYKNGSVVAMHHQC